MFSTVVPVIIVLVVQADEAIHIGPSPSSESYLKMQTIIDVAKATGAQVEQQGVLSVGMTSADRHSTRLSCAVVAVDVVIMMMACDFVDHTEKISDYVYSGDPSRIWIFV